MAENEYLRAIAEKHKNDKLNTFDTNWYALCTDVANRLEWLIKKEIPVKGSSDYLCPKCGAWICGPYIEKEYVEDEGREFEFNYCHKCGSKFDWHTIR